MPHASPAADVLAAVGSSPDGLSEAEAAARLERHGPNTLPRVPPASALDILRSQFRSVVVWLLLVAAFVSLIGGDRVEALAIGLVLLLNAAVGFITEFRARRAIEGLGALDVPRAVTVRSGRARDVDTSALVPGDVIEITGGRHVPADARLLESTDLRVDEAPLTGESLPITKSPDGQLDPATALADRTTMVFKGTTVVAGLGRAVVTATGTDTELGQIGVLVGSVKAEATPLERQLDALGRQLVWLTLGMAAAIAALGSMQGMPIALVIQAGIALAVAAVPEALPAVATTALAVGVHRMARRQALVRHLPAVESLGSTTVVCTDKTRTLTSGVMSVVRVWTAGHAREFPAPADPLVAVVIGAAMQASRRSESRAHGLDPIDAAVEEAYRSVAPADALEITRPPRLTVPFSSERKWMASLCELEEGGSMAYLKGAPTVVLARCSSALTESGVTRMDDALHAALLQQNEKLARDGLRVLGVARGAVDAEALHADASGGPPLRHLVFLGLLGFADPPAAGVGATVARLRAAGLRLIMVTGDQRATAEAIGRQIGVLGPGDHAIDGPALDRMSPEALKEAAADHAAFTRVTPAHKLAIVRALRDRGEIVAMLGDGINDAAALRQADVGVAMGRRGTDVAKQAAAIVLQDDRLETVAVAVEEGRTVFDNIRKFVFYLFSCNLAEVLVLGGALAAGLPLPLMPLSLLWLNLATDTFPALALALEPPEADVMQRPPRRPKDAILSRPFLVEVFAYAGLMMAATLAAFVWALRQAPETAPTVAFMTLGLAQIGHLGNARSARLLLRPAEAISNPYALGGVMVAVLLQLTAIELPVVADTLGLQSLSPREWSVVVACAAVPALVGLLSKALRRRRADATAR